MSTVTESQSNEGQSNRVAGLTVRESLTHRCQHDSIMSFVPCTMTKTADTVSNHFLWLVQTWVCVFFSVESLCERQHKNLLIHDIKTQFSHYFCCLLLDTESPSEASVLLSQICGNYLVVCSSTLTTFICLDLFVLLEVKYCVIIDPTNHPILDV